MASTDILLLTVLIFAAAALYSSVGHAGASGYLAAMGLMGVAALVMKPTALILNILVASIATFRFHRAGCFSWRLFWPFACCSMPLAALGGRMILASETYRILVGVVLMFAAVRLLGSAAKTEGSVRRLPVWVALVCGAFIGLLSGMTGVGGGIFLSPLLLLAGWADPRHTAGVSAPFILVNSVAGLAGHVSKAGALPGLVIPWAVAAVAGGWIGSWLGSRKLGNPIIRRLLAGVLVIAGVKMIL